MLHAALECIFYEIHAAWDWVSSPWAHGERQRWRQGAARRIQNTHFSTGENCVQRTNNDKMHHSVVTRTILSTRQYSSHANASDYSLFPRIHFLLSSAYAWHNIHFVYIYRCAGSLALPLFLSPIRGLCDDTDLRVQERIQLHAIYFVNIFVVFFLSFQLLLLLFSARRAYLCAVWSIWCVCLRRATQQTNAFVMRVSFPPRIPHPPSTDTHHLIIIIIT